MQFICIRAQCAPLFFKLASPSRCSSYSVSLGSCCCHATTQNQFKVSLCPFSWSWSIFNVKHRSAVWRARYLPAPGAGDARLQSLQFQPGRIWINKHKLWGISYRIRPPLKKDIPFTVYSRPSLNKICISLFSAALFLFLSPVFIRKQSINKTFFCCLARLDWNGSYLYEMQPTVGQKDFFSFLGHAARLRAAKSDGVTSVLPAPRTRAGVRAPLQTFTWKQK